MVVLTSLCTSHREKESVAMTEERLCIHLLQTNTGRAIVQWRVCEIVYRVLFAPLFLRHTLLLSTRRLASHQFYSTLYRCQLYSCREFLLDPEVYISFFLTCFLIRVHIDEVSCAVLIEPHPWETLWYILELSSSFAHEEECSTRSASCSFWTYVLSRCYCCSRGGDSCRDKSENKGDNFHKKKIKK
jgi:hypothetical protein